MVVETLLAADLVAAFVALANTGSIRGAAAALNISEQGLRNRLLALEYRLGVSLYRKSRGPRMVTPITDRGAEFLPHAIAYVESARDLGAIFRSGAAQPRLHVAATQYVIEYLLIDVIRQFRRAHPEVQMRISSRTPGEIQDALLRDATLAFAISAPYETPPLIDYHQLFTTPWAIVAPKSHALLRKKSIALEDLAGVPLILFEPGSPGRQPLVEAFHARGLSPNVALETTNTPIIVRLAAARLGVGIIPFGARAILKGHAVGARICEELAPINTGVLTRRGEELSLSARAFVALLEKERQ
jgi:DNA-binding transcriptional LysR family regulator